MSAMPTDGMRAEAQRYRDWKAEGRKGGTEVAARRAAQILSGDELSDDTIVTMSAWFARHEVDKQAEGFSPGEDGYPSPGRVAWAAWGGDPGKSWADSLVAKMDRAMFRAEPNELNEGDFVGWESSGGTARGRIEHIMREGTLGVPDSEFSVNATPEDPAALIRIYRPSDDSEWDETEILVGHRFSTLRKIDPLPSDDDSHGVMPIIAEQRPYPMEHAARLRDPGQYDEFRRENNAGGEGVDFIYGIKEGTAELQAIRFSIEQFTAAQAQQWLADHDHTAIEFEEATGERQSREMITSRRYQRSEVTQFHAVEERVMEFPFSSEYPVERYFGREVLSHAMDAAVLERLNDGAPLLFNHDPDRVVGVVERAWVDDKKKRGYAKVRFSRNKFAQEILDDVRDGILRGVSFGYSIDEMQEHDGAMVATRWQPYEISVVSIPADPSVGVGRSLSVSTMNVSNMAADNAASPNMDAPAPDMEVIRSEAVRAERDRIAAITALGERHHMADLARELIDGGKSLTEAREAVLDKLGQSAMTQPIRSEDITRNDIGLSKAETKRFSFVRALNYLANVGDASARRAAEFEIEVGRAAAAQYERSSNGIVVPNEVLRRDLIAEIPASGGNLVPDELLAGSFIDLLRNRLALAQAGVTMLSGLQGNISIPRQTSAATAYWVGENVAPTESQQAIDQVNMTPKTIAAFVDYSRRLLLQSSIDVEGMIRNDLARVIALEIDRAAIYGTGSSNQPLGLTLTPGIGTETLTNAGTFAQLIAMETDVAVANADVGSLRYIMNATARGLLKSTSKAGNEALFVWENNEVNGYPVIVSNQLQSNDALFGDFSQMVMGMWSGLDLMVDPYAGATAGTVRVIAHQDLDVAVKQPGAFCLGT